MRIPSATVLGISILLSACSTRAQTPRPPSESDVVATVGSDPILLSEVDERALNQGAGDFGGVKLSQALYQARRDAIDIIVRNRLLDAEAKARGIDRQALIEREITGKVAQPTEAEIRAWYDTHADRVQGAPIGQVRSPITALLMQERTLAVQDQYLAVLKGKTMVTVLLEAPREKVASAGRPTRGNLKSPIEIVEFSDFQCPYCLRAYPVVKQILSTYGDRVHLVYRHFPLPNHPNSRPAAEAASCAAEQDKFWEYHDRLFENQSKLGDADLKQDAVEVGMNAAKFNQCFAARKYQKDIDDDMAAGREAGVSGTPGFFVNGRTIEGAQPFEVFKRVIDEELAHR